MNIEYLKYFAELAKIQHYGKAAQALNISQPGLSHAIKTLEEEYGVPLFQKEGRNVSLSSYGKELMNEVEEILDAYLRLEERAAGLRTEEKTVRIGSVYPLAPGTIPRMLREFGATFPFIIYNRLTPEIAEGLQKGKYDIGFCSDLLKSDELEYYPIRGSYIAVAVPKGHPLEKRDTVSLKEIAYYPQIMFSKTSGFRKLQEQLFAAEGISVKPVCAAEEIEVVAGLVENGFGIAVLPYMDIVRLHNIATIPVETSLWKSKFYIARRKYGIRSEQEDAFFQYWGKHRHVMGRGSEWWESVKIGGGAAPIETSEGWLLFYHGVSGTCNGLVYSIGGAILDIDEPSIVKYRCETFLLTPEEWYEERGFVPNVTFPCATIHDAETGRIAVYYGAADSYVGLAFTTVDEVVDYIKEHSVLTTMDTEIGKR